MRVLLWKLVDGTATGAVGSRETWSMAGAAGPHDNGACARGRRGPTGVQKIVWVRGGVGHMGLDWITMVELGIGGSVAIAAVPTPAVPELVVNAWMEARMVGWLARVFAYRGGAGWPDEGVKPRWGHARTRLRHLPSKGLGPNPGINPSSGAFKPRFRFGVRWNEVEPNLGFKLDSARSKSKRRFECWWKKS